MGLGIWSFQLDSVRSETIQTVQTCSLAGAVTDCGHNLRGSGGCDWQRTSLLSTEGATTNTR
jgi:hypothetical protein